MVGYLFGMYDKKTEEVIIMVYNFGSTIAEVMNDSTYPPDVKKFIDNVVDSYTKDKSLITKENALTLLAIQEGISTKLIEDETRGHGFIDYIKCCFELSASTKISIISGHTSIAIDNKYPWHRQNYLNRERKTISLNKEKNINIKPDKNVVKNNSVNFPGVIIQTTIPLSKIYEHVRR